MECTRFLLFSAFFVSCAWSQTIRNWGGETSLREKSYGTFRCEVNGIRRTTEVRWYRQGEEGERIRLFTNFDRTDNAPRRYTVSGQLNMLITSVELEDEGIFICQVVKNKRLPETADNAQEIIYTVRVTSPPKFQNSIPTSQHFNADNAVRLMCGFKGKPQPAVTWKKDGADIANDDRIQLLEEGTETSGFRYRLIINEPREEDIGTYSCHAENTEGTDESGPEDALKVLGTSRRPVVEDSESEAFETMFRLAFSVLTTFPVGKYKVEIQQKNPKDPSRARGTKSGEIPNPKTPDPAVPMKFLVDLTGLSPSTEYMVKVQVRNKYGWSEWSEQHPFTTAVDPNAPPPTSSTTTSTSSTTSATAPVHEHNTEGVTPPPTEEEPPYIGH